MKKLHQKGFTLIEALLIIIALCLIVGVGYYIYNSNHNKNATTASSSSSTAHPSTTPAPSAKKYLEVKELGIKFVLTDKLKNAYYGKVGNYFYLSVHDFDSNSELKGCSVNSTAGDLGILGINVGKVGEPDSGTAAGEVWTQATIDASGMTKVGDSYYGFQSGNAPCYDPTAADAQMNGQTVSEFKQAFITQQSTITKL
jgi:hypothetical protein